MSYKDIQELPECPNGTSYQSSFADNNSISVKIITVFQNGNPFESGRKIVWNKKQMPTWNSFMDHLSRLFHIPVRKIMSLGTCSLVAQYDDMEHCGYYVAIDKYQKFVPLNYLDISKKLNCRKFDSSHSPIRNKESSEKEYLSQSSDHKIVYNSQRISEQLEKYKNTIISVLRNGDSNTCPVKVIIRNRCTNSLDTIINQISEKVFLKYNKPIRKIYNLHGKRIKYADEILNNEVYIVASNEKFVKGFNLDSVSKSIRMYDSLIVDDDIKAMLPFNVHVPQNRSKDHTKIHKLEAMEKSENVNGDKDISNKLVVLPPVTNNSDALLRKEISILKIQAAFRGYKLRKEKFSQKKHKSVSIIQASFRGFKLRNALAELY